MITGEYLVLKGASALSIPVKKGQTLNLVTGGVSGFLEWSTSILGNPWFHVSFHLPDLEITNTNMSSVAKNLQKILIGAKRLNPRFLNTSASFKAISNIEFDIDWGLGSSSSLLVNIASWAGVDPFRLHFSVSEGSGYDIASSSSDYPVLYSMGNGNPYFERADFSPPFHEKLYFVYLGNKKSSEDAVKKFNTLLKDYTKEIREIDLISRAIVNVREFFDFTSLLKQHEDIISSVIEIPSVTSTYFSDFDGTCKSLGAWGGDFVLLATPFPEDDVKDYLSHKGYDTWFRYADLILPLKS